MLTARVIQYAGSTETGSLSGLLVFDVVEWLAKEAGTPEVEKSFGVYLITIKKGSAFLEWLSNQDLEALQARAVQEFQKRAEERESVFLASDAEALRTLLEQVQHMSMEGDFEGFWGGFVADDDSLTLEFE